MVKYLATLAVVVASLGVANVAEARGRHHGCASCGGCPGGVCTMPVAPAPVKAAAVEAAPGTAVVAATPAPVTYTTTARRGLFGWRR